MEDIASHALNSRFNSPGHRILPETLDFLAEECPDRTFASIPTNSDLSNPYRRVTVAEVSKAVHSASQWITKYYGCGHNDRTIAFIGENDLNYPVIWFASIKCGYSMLLLPSANTVTQNVSLLRQCRCTFLLHTSKSEILARRLSQECETYSSEDALTLGLVQDLDGWIASYENPFTYCKTYEEVKSDIILLLQSSGSTGEPKLIELNHAFYAADDLRLDAPKGREVGGWRILDSEYQMAYYSAFPGFHSVGLHFLAVIPLFYNGSYPVLGPADQPPTPELISQILDRAEVQVAAIPPSIIETLSLNPHDLAKLKSLDALIYGGAPLSQQVGDTLCEDVKLITGYGSTEALTPRLLLPEHRKDWDHICIQAETGVVMMPVGDQKFELVYDKSTPNAEYIPICQTLLRHQQQYRSGDLFSPHPSEPGCWKFYCRSDAVIVLSSGEKWNPTYAERELGHNKNAAAVLCVGNGRPQPALLVEKRPNVSNDVEFKDEIWDSVESFNSSSEWFGQISYERIAVVPPGSFVRASKGSVIRKLTEDSMQDLVDEIYDSSNSSSSKTLAETDQPRFCNCGSLQSSISSYVRACVEQIVGHQVEEESDLFAQGMESFWTVKLLDLLKSGFDADLEKKVSHFDVQTIFCNPTIHDLSQNVYKQLSHPEEEVGTCVAV